MQKHDYTQNTIASISDAITNSKNTVENGVLSIEGMAYPWDAGIIHNVVTWFEVLEILGLKEQLKVAFEGADGKFSGVVQKIGKVDSDAANAMNNPLNTLLAIKEKADVIQENSLKPVNVVGIFSGLHSTIWSIDEKYNKLDFNKMTDEEKKAYYETLMAKEELTEEDKKKIQDYLDYLQGKFTVDNTITDEEKYFIDLYEKLHPDEAKAIGTFFENSSKDGIQEYDKFNIKYIAYTSEGDYKKIFFKKISECRVITWNGTVNGKSVGSCYSASTNLIYLNLSNSGLKCDDGAYTTVFHEIGHSIDDLLEHGYDTDPTAKNANARFFTRDELSNDLFDALYADLKNTFRVLVGKCNEALGKFQLNDESEEKVISALLDGRKKWTTLNPYEKAVYDSVKLAIEGLPEFQNESVSDIVGGLTNNSTAGYSENNLSVTSVGAGHDRKNNYWYDENGATYKQLSEFFAEYTSYLMTGQEDKISDFRKIFPNACEILDKAIEDKSDELLKDYSERAL